MRPAALPASTSLVSWRVQERHACPQLVLCLWQEGRRKHVLPSISYAHEGLSNADLPCNILNALAATACSLVACLPTIA